MINDINQLASFVFSKDNIFVLTHASPDGDTLGSGVALCLALRSVGKKANMICGDEIPERYRFATDLVPSEDFSPEFIISVDVADTRLLGKTIETKYGEVVDLSIDHHGTNKRYAKETYVEPGSSSCAEIIFLFLKAAEVAVDSRIADALFLGVSTDTGCFRFSNVTPRTHRIAAELIEAGANAAMINRDMFGTKKLSFLKFQALCLNGMEMFFGGRMSVFTVTRDMLDGCGCSDDDLDPIVSLSREIEGVSLGITIKEKADGTLRISVRTDENIAADKFCALFGGGGHKRAAGCTFETTIDEAKRQLISAAGEFFGE